MTASSSPPGIPSPERLKSWLRDSVGDEHYKLAVVLEGIHARYLQHQTVGEGLEQEGLAVPALIARVHQVLDADL